LTEGIDPNTIDQSNTIGQVTMLLAVIGVFITSVKPFLPRMGSGDKSRSVILKERLELEMKNATIVREVNTNLSEWQIVARSLIRVLKNDLIEHGGVISGQAENLTARLEAIDEREVDYGGDSDL
jgi:hypothetical protein